ncbi:hypothetical protein PTKU46_47820 [Paraburkholderia terrae]
MRWLTAGCVEPSSRAAAVKLASRAADSKADKVCIGGRRSGPGITSPYGPISARRLHNGLMSGNSEVVAALVALQAPHLEA